MDDTAIVESTVDLHMCTCSHVIQTQSKASCSTVQASLGVQSGTVDSAIGTVVHSIELSPI